MTVYWNFSDSLNPFSTDILQSIKNTQVNYLSVNKQIKLREKFPRETHE